MERKARLVTDHGKGDRPRKQSGDVKKQFNDNFDRIFGNKPKEKKDETNPK